MQRSVVPIGGGRGSQAIESCQITDMDDVASLYELVMRSGTETPPPGLADCFRRILFAPENFDPQTPSLVYRESDGAISGFLGVYPRRMTWNGQPIRVACSGQLVTRPDARNKLAGIALLQRFLNGPQDISITDGASPAMGRIWQQMGGHTAVMHSMRWTRLLRPAQFFADVLAGKLGVRPAAVAARPLLKAADIILRRWTKMHAVAEQEPLTARTMAVHWPSLHTQRRLRPDYREPYLHWLLGELERVRARGPFVARLVTSGPRTIGWYMYYLPHERVAEVVQIAFAEGQADSVVDCLFADADQRGAIALQGRLESGLAETLAERGVLFQYHEPLALVHSHHQDLLAAIHSGDSFLTRADGEWWASFHIEAFAQ